MLNIPKMRRLRAFVLICPGVLLLLMAACTAGSSEQQVAVATNTLAPIVSRTPRFTATPIITRTPLPTFTPIPSETPIPPTPSNTPVPTATPPIIGIINSLETVNVREGPGTEFSAVEALVPGTGVQVLGQNTEGTWLNVRMEDGLEGWISARLVRLQPTPTLIPTFTATPDLTALFLGTPLPTALLGGGTITPTPPRSAVTATPPGTPAEASAVVTEGPTQSFLPIRDLTAVYATATALASGGAITTPRPGIQASATALSLSLTLPATPATPGAALPTLPTTTPAGTLVPVTPGLPTTTAAGGSVGQGVDVFALCDTPALGGAAPTNLVAGSTIDVFWAWFASTREQVEEHTAAVTYEVRVNDVPLTNWRQFGQAIRQQGNQYVRYWYVPFGPLTAGQYRITYRATWSRSIFDGAANFGPGTANVVEEGSCTFTVR